MLLRSFWDTIVLLAPSAGTYASAFPGPHGLPPAGAPHAGPLSAVSVLCPSVWRQPALTPAEQPLGESLMSMKDTQRKDAHTAEKIRVHQSQNTECLCGNTERQPQERCPCDAAFPSTLLPLSVSCLLPRLLKLPSETLMTNM